MRVLVAGFQHETNTFAPSKADWAAFNRGDGFPAYIHGQAMLASFTGINMPISGFMAYGFEQGWSLKPSVWAGASPSAHVTREAFERIAQAILDDAKAKDFDAVYLDLHGAAVAEHLDDCEGELLARLRLIVGHNLPIVVSLDSHANVTQQMISLADGMTCFRTYPHINMADTGRRAGHLLSARLKANAPLNKVFVRLPYLLPLSSQSTMLEPCASAIAHLKKLDQDGQIFLNFATGFPAADFAECGPTVWGYGARAQTAVTDMLQYLVSNRAAWRIQVLSADEAVTQALALTANADNGPVVIADTQDNPGAGGDSNTTGMLRALFKLGAGKQFPQRIALGLLHDPQTALAAHQAGVGATIKQAIGKAVDTGWAGMSEPAIEQKWQVIQISDGKVLTKGPMMRGVTVNLGPSALLLAQGIYVCVITGKTQMLDREYFRFLGVEPEQMKILVNKSSVHFRADFAPIASHILVAKSPGPMAADPGDLPWKQLSKQTDTRP
jgi:microcystin degradation protein MlrC